MDIVEKNKQLRLKAATNKDFKRLDTIPSLKFGAKIRGEPQIMKIRLKKTAIARPGWVSAD
jgi:hypothetical protein